MKPATTNFRIDEVIKHRLFNYYGAFYAVGPVFMDSDGYETVARNRPPKDHPRYHVLVDGADAMTCVAERNPEHCPQSREINHPLLKMYLDGHDNSIYLAKSPVI